MSISWSVRPRSVLFQLCVAIAVILFLFATKARAEDETGDDEEDESGYFFVVNDPNGEWTREHCGLRPREDPTEQIAVGVWNTATERLTICVMDVGSGAVSGPNEAAVSAAMANGSTGNAGSGSTNANGSIGGTFNIGSGGIEIVGQAAAGIINELNGQVAAARDDIVKANQQIDETRNAAENAVTGARSDLDRLSQQAQDQFQQQHDAAEGQLIALGQAFEAWEQEVKAAQEASLRSTQAKIDALGILLGEKEQRFGSAFGGVTGTISSIEQVAPVDLAPYQQAIDNAISDYNTLVKVFVKEQDVAALLQEFAVPGYSVPGQLPIEPIDYTDAYNFKTEFGTPEWQKLVDTKRYELSARSTTSSSTYATKERTALLDVADLGLHVADECYAAKDYVTGESILEGVNGALDLVLGKVLENTFASKGASFIMGVLEGATGGLLNATPLEGHERVYAVGQAVGVVIGLGFDAFSIVSGFELALGGTILGVGGAGPTAGASLVVGAAAAAAGTAMVSAGVAGIAVHYEQFATALNGISEPGWSAARFRTNLAKATGVNPTDAQAHHVLPQKFESEFERLGLKIHDPKYGTWWNTEDHLRNAWAYNDAWEEFLGTSRTVEEVIQFAREIAAKYGLVVYF